MECVLVSGFAACTKKLECGWRCVGLEVPWVRAHACMCVCVCVGYEKKAL